MKICPQCERTMERVIAVDKIIFRCFCGTEIAGGPEDARIASHVYHAGETADKYQKLILNSPHDRTNQQVRKDCPQCGLDYLTQLRIGPEEVIIYTCKCGYVSTGGLRTGKKEGRPLGRPMG